MHEFRDLWKSSYSCTLRIILLFSLIFFSFFTKHPQKPQEFTAIDRAKFLISVKNRPSLYYFSLSLDLPSSILNFIGSSRLQSIFRTQIIIPLILLSAASVKFFYALPLCSVHLVVRFRHCGVPSRRLDALLRRQISSASLLGRRRHFCLRLVRVVCRRRNLWSFCSP